MTPILAAFTQGSLHEGTSPRVLLLLWQPCRPCSLLGDSSSRTSSFMPEFIKFFFLIALLHVPLKHKKLLMHSHFLRYSQSFSCGQLWPLGWWEDPSSDPFWQQLSLPHTGELRPPAVLKPIHSSAKADPTSADLENSPKVNTCRNLLRCSLILFQQIHLFCMPRNLHLDV